MIDTRSKASRNTSREGDPGGALLRLENLCVDFPGNAVLRDVNLSIARGETLAIIGESGCGKTVLLKTIIGLVRPSRGKVFFEGRNLAEMDERQLDRGAHPLRLPLPAGGAVRQPHRGRERGLSPAAAHRRRRRRRSATWCSRGWPRSGCRRACSAQKPAELSGGMRKRVGLARALALEPEVMLYDEPTTGLDPIMGDVINELILSTRRHHPVTSVLVTHDMRTARKVADRVVMLYPLSRLGQDEPQIIFDGPPARLDDAAERRVRQFVRGEAGDRLRETRAGGG